MAEIKQAENTGKKDLPKKSDKPIKENKKSDAKFDGKLGIILIRSRAGVNGYKKSLLDDLMLRKKHTLFIVNDSEAVRGKIKRIGHLVTWGELNSDIINKIGNKKTLHLHPPRGGFEKKGIKMPFKLGGATGYRAEKINDLINRMWIE